MQGEFFAANTNIASSLIREAIQNSLDARLKNGGLHEKTPVKIRIFFSGSESSLPWSRVKPFFNEAWGHYTAGNSGLSSCPEQNEPCKFFVIEDFNTTGLNGDIRQFISPINGEQNSFYSFFRAEGQSNKRHTDRGRWGVGKFVFPKASRIKTFFGLTVRDEDQKKYLVGQTILKSHRVNNVAYTPDGWYGGSVEIHYDENKTDSLHMPVDREEHRLLVDGFCEAFRIQRQTEPGLSIIVPFIDEDIDGKDIVKAVLNDYFWPILTGELFVSIELSDQMYNIERGSLEKFSEQFKDERTVEIKARIELAKWATEVRQDEFITIHSPRPTVPPKWTEELISSELQVQLRKKLEAEDRIAIRIPITIRERQKESKYNETYYNVFLQRHPDAKNGEPVFIREGLIIPDVRCKETHGTVALVIADEPVIADFLGNAENPAHTDWHANSENFKDRYIYGYQTLSFIKNTISSIINIIDESSSNEDRTLLLDFFSIPAPSEGPKRQCEIKTDNIGDESEKPIVPEIPTPLKPYKVSKVQGGFTISNGDKTISVPATLDIKVFYDRRGGKAKYSPHDFRLNKSPIETTGKNVKLLGVKDNLLKVEILEQDFRLTVKGFDIKRDLLVKPSIEQEIEDATT